MLREDFEKARTSFEFGDYVTAAKLLADLDRLLRNSDSDCEGDIRMGLAVQDYLERIPASHRNVVISRQSDCHWEWFVSSEKQSYEITGKYIFFSRIRTVLTDVACEELGCRRFHLGKIPIEGKAVGDEYVLCLYYSDDSLKYELADKYGNREDLKYRYWKSDESTRRGEYSQQFLSRSAKSDAVSGCDGAGCNVSSYDHNSENKADTKGQPTPAPYSSPAAGSESGEA
jgi:hypothetical protein